MTMLLLRNALGMAAEMTEAFAATVAAVAPVVLLVAVVEVVGYERERRERGHRFVGAAVGITDLANESRRVGRTGDAALLVRLKTVQEIYEVYPVVARALARRLGVSAPVGTKKAWVHRLRWLKWIAWACWAAVLVAQAVAAMIALNALRDLSHVNPMADEVCAVIVSVGVGWVALWPIARVTFAYTWGGFEAMSEHVKANDPFLRALQDRIAQVEAEQA
ncbi:hypothetical protein [Streptomyces scabiei]|uniref:hypothetical protein n=2 Tax=Streptomyces TaxID=1883 RepID=UPI00131AF5C4|nr:hypothetical protein [Streptomyces scabiei]MDX3067416.1 hypothetical protein [Streptomyces sp. ND04-05B]